MCHGQQLGDALRRARKGHECDECRRTIPQGRRYYTNTVVDRGAFSSSKLCRTCYLAVVRAPDGEACWELSGEGLHVEGLREKPWRATLAWMRAAWRTALGRRAADGGEGEQ